MERPVRAPLIGLALVAVMLLPAGGFGPSLAGPTAAPFADPGVRPLVLPLGPSVGASPVVPYTVNLLDGANQSGAVAGYGLDQPTAAAYDPTNGELFVGAEESANVAVVDASTGEVLRFIPLSGGGPSPANAGPGATPWDLSLDAANGLLYISQGSDFLDVVNTSSNEFVGSIPLGIELSGLAIDPGGQRLFAADDGNGTLDILDLPNDTIVAEVPVGAAPQDAAYDPGTDTAFVTVAGNDTVAEVNLTSDRVARWIAVPFVPWGITYDATTGLVAVTGCGATEDASLITPAKGTVLLSAPAGGCGAFLLPIPAAHALAVSDQTGPDLYVVSDTTLALLDSVDVAPGGESFGLALNASSGEMFVTDDGIARVAVVSTSTFSVLSDIPVATDPVAGTFVPSESVLDMVDPVESVVESLNLSNGSAAVDYTVGSGADGVAFDGTSGDLYVSSTGDGLVALDPKTFAQVAAIPTGSDGSGPITLDSSNGDILSVGYVPCASGVCDDLYVVNPSTQTAASGIALPAPVDGTEVAYDAPNDLALLPMSDGAVAFVNTSTDQLAGYHGVGSDPDGVAYDPTDGTLWVTNGQSANVTVLNPKANRTVANLSTGTGEPQYVAFDPALGEMVVATSNATLGYRFFSASTNAPAANLTLPFRFQGKSSPPNGALSFVSASDGLAILDGDAVGFLQGPPANVAIVSANVTPSITSVGHAVEFAIVASGGSSAISYAYSGLPSGCSSANAASLGCVPTKAGSFTITVRATNSTGASASSSILLTVFPALLLGNLTGGGPIDDYGVDVILNVSVSGGVGGYSFNWTGLPAGCPTNETGWMLCRPNVDGRYTVNLTVTDSEGANASVGPIRIYVESPLELSLQLAPAATVDVGQVLIAQARASSGTAPYAYGWIGVPSGCPAASGTQFQCTFQQPATFNLTAYATDLGGLENVSRTASIEVNSDPTIAPIVSQPSVGEAGRPLELSVKVANGTGPYTITWSGLPAGCLSANSTTIECTPAQNGTFLVTVTAVDLRQYRVTVSRSEEVDAALGSVRLDASVPATEPGEPVTFTANLSSGTPPFTYNWSGLPAGCLPADSASLPCLPALAGTTNVTVTVTDPSGYNVTSPPLAFTVYPTLLLARPSAPRSIYDVGQSFVLTETADGGAAPLSYDWSGLPGGCANFDAAQIACLLSAFAPGSWSVSVNVTDALGFYSVSPGFSLRVGSALSAHLALNATSLDVGQTLEAGVNLTGGSGPVSVNWTGLPTYCAAPTGASVDCRLRSVQTFLLDANVTDAAMAEVALSAKITVDPAPEIGSPTLSNGTIDLGQSTELAVDVEGSGAGGDRLLWTGLPYGCAPPGNDSASFECAPSVAGPFEVSVEVVDANGGSATAGSVALLVETDPAPVVRFSTDPLDLGGSTVITVNVSGGSGHYRIGWVGLPNGCLPSSAAALNLTCRPATTGRYSIRANVTDTNGFSALSPVATLTVVSATSGAGPAFSNPLLWGVAGVLGAVVIVALVLIVRKRRAGAPGPAPPGKDASA